MQVDAESVWPCTHEPRRTALTGPRGPGPAPRWPVPSETAHSLLSALLSSPLYVLCWANKHDISHKPVPTRSCLCSPDTYSPVGILTRLLLSLCELEILNDKAGKTEVPESHVDRFLSCRPSWISEGRYFHVQTENVVEYFGVFFFKPFYKIFVQQIVFTLCNRQS